MKSEKHAAKKNAEKKKAEQANTEDGGEEEEPNPNTEEEIEEAEEIAALNLAKFRKAQQELEETEDRTKMAEAQLSVARAGSVGFM